MLIQALTFEKFLRSVIHVSCKIHGFIKQIGPKYMNLIRWLNRGNFCFSNLSF